MIAESLFALQSMLHPIGAAGTEIGRLGIELTVVAVVVTVVMTVLFIFGARHRDDVVDPGSVPLRELEGRDRGAKRGLKMGMLATAVILGWAAVYSIKVMLDYGAGLDRTKLTVEVTGYQYWWEIAYPAGDGFKRIVTANELHIPAGVPVKLKLRAGDVIHSFWVPSLTGKTDLVPGHPTEMWIAADQPGVSTGNCAEYCGISHANMRLRVVAQTPAEFAAWRRNQEAIPPVDSAVAAILQKRACAGCHTITGQMSGRGGPDLTHFASRETLAAGVRENTLSNLEAWLVAPAAIKPGTLMPATALTSDELRQVSTYLRSLR